METLITESWKSFSKSMNKLFTKTHKATTKMFTRLLGEASHINKEKLLTEN